MRIVGSFVSFPDTGHYKIYLLLLLSVLRRGKRESTRKEK